MGILAEAIQKLQYEAHERGMDIDYETWSLVPYSTQGTRQPWEHGDNNPADPEQNIDIKD